MKRCPKCSRTFTTNTQKFCTHDGVVLETIEAASPTAGSETVRIDASDLDDDAPTKAISRELASDMLGEFDPLKTVMSRPDGTFTGGSRNTSDIFSSARDTQFCVSAVASGVRPLSFQRIGRSGFRSHPIFLRSSGSASC